MKKVLAVFGVTYEVKSDITEEQRELVMRKLVKRLNELEWEVNGGARRIYRDTMLRCHVEMQVREEKDDD